MRLIRNRPGNTSQGPGGSRPSVVAIGNFDGVHLGHQALVQRCREIRRPDERVAVLTFEPLPQAFFRPQQAPARLSTVHQKLSFLRLLDVDTVWMMRFDAKLAQLSATDFSRHALSDGLQARCVVVGEDFRFGQGREGDVGTLQSAGFEVSIVEAVKVDGQRVSSTLIRKLLGDGEFRSAERLLGRPFVMGGHVVRGARLGRKLGFPTANLRIRARPSPLQGVFAVYSRIGQGPWLPAVSSLGWRPAVNGAEPLLEVHFFDFEQDLYGQRLEVQFVAKLRDELDFENLDELVGQMHRDAKQARACLARAPVPDEPADMAI